jgi:hypothetical protein
MGRRMHRASEGVESRAAVAVRVRVRLGLMQRARAGAVLGCALAASGALASTLPPRARGEETAVLTRMLQEGQSFQVRAGAATVMGQRRNEASRPELEGALGDTHPTVRAAAANALGRIGSEQSLPPLRGATRDRVREVASTAQQAVQTIESHSSSGNTLLAAEDAASTKPRFGLMLGQMINQTSYIHPEVSAALVIALQRQLQGVPGIVMINPERTAEVDEAVGQGLTVFRLDATVTHLSTTHSDGQISVHCEVALLVVDRPTGSLRTLFKGAARAVEIPKGDLDEQQLDIAQRVVAGAVRSALRNADSALAVAVR